LCDPGTEGSASGRQVGEVVKEETFWSREGVAFVATKTSKKWIDACVPDWIINREISERRQ